VDFARQLGQGWLPFVAQANGEVPGELLVDFARPCRRCSPLCNQAC